MTRRRPETRLIRSRSGTRRIAVERGVVLPLAGLPEQAFVPGAIDPIGALAADCEAILRGCGGRFPVEFMPTALGVR